MKLLKFLCFIILAAIFTSSISTKLHAEVPFSNLRGTMVPTYIPKDHLIALSSWNANLIRWQMTSGIGEVPDRASFDRWLGGALNHMDELLPVCELLGIKVVLDLHTPPGERYPEDHPKYPRFKMFDDPALEEAFVDAWRRMAERYKDNPTIIGYDILNEPAAKNKRWRKVARKAINEIRRFDPNTHIIVEPSYGVPSQIKTFKPFKRVNNLVYSVHMYDPMWYTHQGIAGRPLRLDFSYPGRNKNGKLINRRTLRGSLSEVIDFQKKHNAPIFIGEFSAPIWAGGADNYIRDNIDIYEHRGWSWTYHAFRESHIWDVEKNYNFETEQAIKSDTPNSREINLRNGLARNPAKKPVRLLAGHTNKCLDVRGSSTANGAVIQQWDCMAGPPANQAWEVIGPINGNQFNIVSKHSGKCLDLTSHINGARVQQLDCTSGRTNQLWYLEVLPRNPQSHPKPNTTLYIKSALNGKCMEVGGVSPYNGAGISAWDCVPGFANQTWRPLSTN